jgi:hypothetical protein
LFGRWPIALAAIAVLAGAVLLRGLGDFGLWDPQERQLADRQVPRRAGTVGELDAMVRPAVLTSLAPRPAPSPTGAVPPSAPAATSDLSCLRVPPHGALARSLTPRAAAWGRDLDDSDAGRRFPLAMLGILTVLATAGIALRTSGPRACVLTGLVMLSMPLLVLQSRQLTSEIGTPAGGALVLYGLVAFGRGRRSVLGVLDGIVSVAAIAVGCVIGFAAGGALLGLLVPLGAFAAAGGLGAPACLTGWRWLRRRWPTPPGSEVGPPGHTSPGAIVDQLKALMATLATIAIAGVLLYQLYDLVAVEDLPPGSTQAPLREVLGRVIVPSKCWSSALGGILLPTDDLKSIYDSTFEQIGYGTYPWGVLAPIAIGALLAGADRERRRVGGLALAWAGAAWIAGEIFQRRVGFTLYAGFPALALALGCWLDAWFTNARIGEANGAHSNASALLIATFAVLGALVLGKDMFAFADKLPPEGSVNLPSLLVGGGSVPYPTTARVALFAPRLWVLVLGVVVALSFALALALPLRRIARAAFATTFGATALVAAFWAFAWQAELGEHLSSKVLFDSLHELAHYGDSIILMGDLGDAPRDYGSDLVTETVTTRDPVIAALGRPNRVFAIVPQTELCQLHHDMAHKSYFVVDDRNIKSLLISNRVDGTTDKNPLRDTILHEPPKSIRFRPKGRVVWDNRIELLGWDMPTTVPRGSKFQVRTYYKVLQPISGAWHVLYHFDGPLRFNGDHMPIDDHCTTGQWAIDDYIVDTTTVVAGGTAFQSGSYDVWTGFWTGSAPNFKNMPLSAAPGDMRDTTDRVKITTITLD